MIRSMPGGAAGGNDAPDRLKSSCVGELSFGRTPANDHDLALANDHDLAAALAGEAGEMLLALRGETPPQADPATLGAIGDRRSHELIASRLAECRHDDALLSEEAPDDRERLGNNRVWIVDPLDGTRQYCERSRTDWAVHVALVEGGEAVSGAVALPAAGILIKTARASASKQVAGASTRGKDATGGRRPVVVASRSRHVSEAKALAEHFGGGLLRIGSVGAKVAALIRGEADVYVHSGGLWEWDAAAPSAVARAHGLRVSRFDGSKPRFNLPSPLLDDLIVCRHELAEEVLGLLAAPSGGRPQPGSATP